MAQDGIARVNGVALHDAGEQPDAKTLRQLACTELLRQEALARGADGADPAADIEALLAREVDAAEPDEAACRRYFEGHLAHFRRGERLRLRHVLFAVTPGVDVVALRGRAEALLVDLRCATPESGAFGEAAGRLSNCPSGAQGGELGWLGREDCAPEFGAELFGQASMGVLPRLVHSRHGLHVVEILEREAGIEPSYEDVRDAVRLQLRQRTWAQGVWEYLRAAAARAELEGVTLGEEESPLVQ